MALQIIAAPYPARTASIAFTAVSCTQGGAAGHPRRVKRIRQPAGRVDSVRTMRCIKPDQLRPSTINETHVGASIQREEQILSLLWLPSW